MGVDRLREAEAPVDLKWLCVGKTRDLDVAICALVSANVRAQRASDFARTSSQTALVRRAATAEIS